MAPKITRQVACCLITKRSKNAIAQHKHQKKKDFGHSTRPPYAILSHTWGNDEITLQELEQSPTPDDGLPHPLQSRAGYLKIEGCCVLSRSHGYEWVWIDSCCIDKTSSAELSEAINSMYRWYKEAHVCYVYLSDVSISEDYRAPKSQFRRSRWWTRGWTLQELIAPITLQFYDASWGIVDNRSRLRDLIQDITGIPAEFFINRPIGDASVAQRMSWAARRETTREEDMSYCLLGLFDVNMPLLYGEGHRAFRRLQEEIIKRGNDQTILCWGLGRANSEAEATSQELAILAKHPSDFANCSKVVPCLAWKPQTTISIEKVETGISLELLLTTGSPPGSPGQLGVYGMLNCRLTDNFSDLIAIPLGGTYTSIGKQGPLLRLGKDLYTKRLRYRNPVLLNYQKETVFMSPTRKLILTEELNLLKRDLDIWGHSEDGSAHDVPVLVKEPGGLSCFSWQLDPSLELIPGVRSAVIRRKAPTSSSAPISAFLYYRKTTDVAYGGGTLVVKVVLSEGSRQTARCECFLAVSPAHNPDLENLTWKNKVKYLGSPFSVRRSPRLQAVLGTPMRVAALNGPSILIDMLRLAESAFLGIAPSPLMLHIYGCDSIESWRTRYLKLAIRLLLLLGGFVLLGASIPSVYLHPLSTVLLFASVFKVRWGFFRVILWIFVIVMTGLTIQKLRSNPY